MVFRMLTVAGGAVTNVIDFSEIGGQAAHSNGNQVSFDAAGNLYVANNAVTAGKWPGGASLQPGRQLDYDHELERLRLPRPPSRVAFPAITTATAWSTWPITSCGVTAARCRTKSTRQAWSIRGLRPRGVRDLATPLAAAVRWAAKVPRCPSRVRSQWRCSADSSPPVVEGSVERKRRRNGPATPLGLKPNWRRGGLATTPIFV